MESLRNAVSRFFAATEGEYRESPSYGYAVDDLRAALEASKAEVCSTITRIAKTKDGVWFDLELPTEVADRYGLQSRHHCLSTDRNCCDCPACTSLLRRDYADSVAEENRDLKARVKQLEEQLAIALLG